MTPDRHDPGPGDLVARRARPGHGTLGTVPFFTDLNLDGRTPIRVRPRLGEWGPRKVPSTRLKKVQRILAPIVFVLVLGALVGVGYYFFRVLIPQS